MVRGAYGSCLTKTGLLGFFPQAPMVYLHVSQFPSLEV